MLRRRNVRLFLGHERSQLQIPFSLVDQILWCLYQFLLAISHPPHTLSPMNLISQVPVFAWRLGFQVLFLRL